MPELHECPMKPGLMITCFTGDMFSERLIDECHCPGCPLYKRIFNNPHDGFLTRHIATMRYKEASA